MKLKKTKYDYLSDTALRLTGNPGNWAMSYIPKNKYNVTGIYGLRGNKNISFQLGQRMYSFTKNEYFGVYKAVKYYVLKYNNGMCNKNMFFTLIKMCLAHNYNAKDIQMMVRESIINE